MKTKKTKPHFSQHLNPKPRTAPPQPSPSTTKQTIPLNAPKDWQADFRHFNFKLGFMLSLSPTMIEFLCATAEDVQWDRGNYGAHHGHAPDNWIATETALQKRGLVARKSDPERDASFAAHDRPGSRKSRQSYCQLTPAGEAVVQLFRVTGVFVKSDNAIFEAPARKAQKSYEYRQRRHKKKA